MVIVSFFVFPQLKFMCSHFLLASCVLLCVELSPTHTGKTKIKNRVLSSRATKSFQIEINKYKVMSFMHAICFICCQTHFIRLCFFCFCFGFWCDKAIMMIATDFFFGIGFTYDSHTYQPNCANVSTALTAVLAVWWHNEIDANTKLLLCDIYERVNEVWRITFNGMKKKCQQVNNEKCWRILQTKSNDWLPLNIFFKCGAILPHTEFENDLRLISNLPLSLRHRRPIRKPYATHSNTLINQSTSANTICVPLLYRTRTIFILPAFV